MKRLCFFLIIFFSNFLILFNNQLYQMFENGVYYKYLESFVTDFDFNIYNQFDSAFDKWMITPTLNHFDYHSPFVSVILFLAYLLLMPFKGVKSFANYLPFQAFILSRFLVVLLVFRMTDSRDRYLLKYGALAIFFSSISWNVLFDSTDVSFLCLIFTFPIFFILRSVVRDEKVDASFLGLLIGLFACIKPDGWPWLIIVFILLVLKKKWEMLFKFIFVSFFCMSQILIVNYIRYETIVLPHPAVHMFHNSVFHIFLGSNGMLIKSPILFLSLIVLMVSSFRHSQRDIRHLSRIGVAIVLLKGFIIGAAIPTNSDDFGSRLFLAEIPFYALGLFVLHGKFKPLIKLCVALFVPVTIIHLYFWLYTNISNDFDYRLVYVVSLDDFINSWDSVVEYYHYCTNRLKHSFFSIFSLSTLTSIVVLSFSEITKKRKRLPREIFAFLFVLSLLMSLSNIVFNKINAQKSYLAGEYEGAVTVRGNALFYDEVVDLIYYSARQAAYGIPLWFDPDTYLKDYLLKIRPNIINDPNGLLKNLEPGKHRPSFWQLKRSGDGKNVQGVLKKTEH